MIDAHAVNLGPYGLLLVNLTLLSMIGWALWKTERNLSSQSDMIVLFLLGVFAVSGRILLEPIPFLDSYRIVFRNGSYVASLSDLPVAESVVCAPLGEVDADFQNEYHKAEWVGAMNASYHQGGLFLKVSKNTVLDRPIVVHHLTDGQDIASFPRHYITLEEGAKAEVVIWSSATENSSGMCNGLLEAHVAPNAYLVIDKVCNEGGEVFKFSHEQINQARDSRVKINTFTIKGHWVRNELEIVSNGAGTGSVFNGAYMPTGSEHVDNHTTMDHAHPNGTSSELYRGIMYDKSTGVFNGKVFVRQDAQQTNAFQQNSNIVVILVVTLMTTLDVTFKEV